MATPPSDIAARKADLSAAKRALLQQRLRKNSAAFEATAIAPVDRSAPLPMSHAQERLWFIDRLIDAGHAYNVPVFLKVCGPLNVAALTKSLNSVVARHEVLRTSFPEQGGVPCVQVAGALDIFIPVHAVASSDAMRLADERALDPFDLSTGPLLRADLYRTSTEEHLLLLCMHHIVSDGWSMDLLREELVQGYRAAVAGSADGLKPLSAQYVDFAAAQRSREAQQRIEHGLNHWRETLTGAPSLLTLQAGAGRPAVQSLAGKRKKFTGGAETAAAIQTLAASTGASAFMIGLAAFNALIARYTGQRDFVIGTPVSGRTHPAVQKLIGCFVNTLPIRASVNPDESFRDLLNRVRAAALDTMEHQDVPFERIVDAVNPERAMSYEPLCQVVFTCRENPVEAFDLTPGTRVEVLETETVPAKFDLVFTLKLRPDRIDGTADFNPDVYDAWFVDQFVRHYATLLSAALASPDTPVLALPLMDNNEIGVITRDWNNSAAVIRDERPVHTIIHDIAIQYSENTAVCTADISLTYAALNARANVVASALRKRGAGPDVLVALYAGRGIEAVVGALGILKAGAAFVPIDPAYPRERVDFMLEDCGADIIVASSGNVPDRPDATVILIDDIATQSADSISSMESGPGRLAYAIYTSGTTGRPKAALLEHVGLTNLVQAQRELLNIEPGTRVLQFAPPSFDAWVWEFIMALCNGGTLCIPQDSERLGDGLAAYMASQAVEVALLPPSVLQVLPERPPLPHLRVLFSGGEACTPSLAQRWAAGRTFINAYGPTESTVVATAHVWKQSETMVPIGRPIANLRAYVLDDAGEPLPPGCEGELYVGGAGVARGYLNRDQLTAERFVPDPFSNAPGARMYRTGDRVRWTPRGEIIYMGRADDQVKVRGFRIELGEIEAAIRSMPYVCDCACTVEHAGTPDARVAAFVETAVRDETAFRERLRESLPPHLVPSNYDVRRCAAAVAERQN
jgi:amino acid adenylation domain-containing protein